MLQAPPLLQLGQLATPVLPDPLIQHGMRRASSQGPADGFGACSASGGAGAMSPCAMHGGLGMLQRNAAGHQAMGSAAQRAVSLGRGGSQGREHLQQLLASTAGAAMPSVGHAAETSVNSFTATSSASFSPGIPPSGMSGSLSAPIPHLNSRQQRTSKPPSQTPQTPGLQNLQGPYLPKQSESFCLEPSNAGLDSSSLEQPRSWVPPASSSSFCAEDAQIQQQLGQFRQQAPQQHSFGMMQGSQSREPTAGRPSLPPQPNLNSSFRNPSYVAPPIHSVQQQHASPCMHQQHQQQQQQQQPPLLQLQHAQAHQQVQAQPPSQYTQHQQLQYQYLQQQSLLQSQSQKTQAHAAYYQMGIQTDYQQQQQQLPNSSKPNNLNGVASPTQHQHPQHFMQQQRLQSQQPHSHSRQSQQLQQSREEQEFRIDDSSLNMSSFQQQHVESQHRVIQQQMGSQVSSIVSPVNSEDVQTHEQVEVAHSSSLPASASVSLPSPKLRVPQPQSGRPRILVTGATGLLGRQVMEIFRDGPWEVRGLCKRRARPPNIIACDLTKDGAAALQIEEFRPHAVLHLAAEWRPEVLRQDPVSARQLNVDSTGAVAAACERFGAWLIHISADCVFDGTSPPYSVDAKPNPLSEYGWHKLHGEQLALAACPRTAVLRVPLLYGPLESLSDSAVTSLYSDLESGIREVDAWQRCYPTWTGDVANVLRAMIELHLAGERLRGIYHWQGNEQLTWHDMMLLVAEVTGLDASGVTAVRSAPSMPLPRDTRLECSRLGRLIESRSCQTPFKDGLRKCLAPFKTQTASPYSPAVNLFANKSLQDELKQKGPALQELFWEELERTRARLREAGFVSQKRDAFREVSKGQRSRDEGAGPGADLVDGPALRDTGMLRSRAHEQRV